MKKIIAWCLMLVLMLGFIPLNSLTANAASTKEVILHHICEDESYIKITREHEKISFLRYETTIVFEAKPAGVSKAKKYEVSLTSFSKTSQTVSKVCANNRKLREANVFTNIEKLFYSKLLLADSRNDFINFIKGTALDDYRNQIISIRKDTCDDIIYGAAKHIFGFETPISDFISDCRGTVENVGVFEKMYKKYCLMFSDFASISIESLNKGEGELEKKYREIRDESAANLIDVIYNMK